MEHIEKMIPNCPKSKGDEVTEAEYRDEDDFVAKLQALEHDRILLKSTLKEAIDIKSALSKRVCSLKAQLDMDCTATTSKKGIIRLKMYNFSNVFHKTRSQSFYLDSRYPYKCFISVVKVCVPSSLDIMRVCNDEIGTIGNDEIVKISDSPDVGDISLDTKRVSNDEIGNIGYSIKEVEPLDTKGVSNDQIGHSPDVSNESFVTKGVSNDEIENIVLSVHLNIEKGEFDSVLPWPFTNVITFRVVNETGKNDIVKTFKPQQSHHNERIHNEQVLFSVGTLNLVTLEALQKNGFIKKDSITIECKVHWD